MKAKLDIAEIIGEYVQLKPAGTGSLKGLCPFHNERSPSFHVSRERQIFKCFGCDKGGDIFSFVMEMEGMTFPEALRHLGRRAGVEIPEYTPQKPEVANARQRMLEMYDLAAQYYSLALREYPHGAAARTYVESRGITPELREKFRLGAAPDSWDALSTALIKRGFTARELIDGGLSLPKKLGDGVIDRFRNRLMIPICDAQGQVIAFTGRVLPGTSQEKEGGKYVNSPETALYKKSEVLFGLHLAKSAIRKKECVIVVEGNLDVIASHKAGVEHIVASSGTALTEMQLRMLSRYTRRIIFCLDEDAAGFAAAKRAFALALQLQQDATLAVEIRCLVLPPGVGKDPDEVVKKDPARWQELADSSYEVVEYLFQKTIRTFEEQGEVSSTEGRKKLIDELLPSLGRISRPDEQYLYLLRLADATHVDIDVLKGMIQKNTTEKRAPASVGAGARPAAAGHTQPLRSALVSEPDKLDKAAAFLLGLALAEERLAKDILDRVPIDLLKDPWSLLYASAKQVYSDGQLHSSPPQQKQPFFLRLRAYLDSASQGSLLSILDTLALQTDEIIAGLSLQARRDEAKRHLALFSRAQAESKQKELEAAIRHAELAGDSAKLTALMAEYASLLNTLRAAQ